MNIILGGGRGSKYSKETDELIKKILQENKKKILYVPIALRNYKTFKECLNWFTKTYPEREYNIKMLEDFKKITQKELNTFDVVFIGGGNTYNLLKEIRTTKFDKKLIKYSKQKTIYGGSAGAIILGKNITTSNDENNTKLKNLQGLSLINYAIWPHYEKKTKQKNKRIHQKNKN